MSLTRTDLERELEGLRQQYAQAQAEAQRAANRAQAVAGALQLCESLLARCAEPDPAPDGKLSDLPPLGVPLA